MKAPRSLLLRLLLLLLLGIRLLLLGIRLLLLGIRLLLGIGSVAGLLLPITGLSVARLPILGTFILLLLFAAGEERKGED